jgi:N-acetylneuraminic acid mutarotase
LFGPGCAFVNGVFLVFGGAALAEQGMNYQTAIYAFDLKNFAAGWNKLGDLGEAKGFVQAVVTENKVFVLGGTKTEEKSPVAGPNDAIEIIEVTRLN